MALKVAQRKSKKFKGSIQGASGAGKTFTALRIAGKLISLTDPGETHTLYTSPDGDESKTIRSSKRIAVIDTENGAELYAPPFGFDVDDEWTEKNGKVNYAVSKLIAKMTAIAAVKGPDGKPLYGAIVVDSATHIYKEAGGLLSMIDTICDAERAKGRTPNSFAAWKQVDPIYRELMTFVRNFPLHVFLCIRAKQAYEKETTGKGGMKKVGMEPEFRDGFEFEMDAQFSIDEDHIMVPRKHRLQSYLDGKVFKQPGADVAQIIYDWSTDGVIEMPVAPEVQAVVEMAVGLANAAVTPAEKQAASDALQVAGDAAEEKGELLVASQVRQAAENLEPTNTKNAFLVKINQAPDEPTLTATGKAANAAKNAGQLVGADWDEVKALFMMRKKEFATADQAAQ